MSANVCHSFTMAQQELQKVKQKEKLRSKNRSARRIMSIYVYDNDTISFQGIFRDIALLPAAEVTSSWNPPPQLRNGRAQSASRPQVHSPPG
jgi:hypothetical protein